MVEMLQQSPCSVSAPLYERYQVIKDLSETHSINVLCQAMKVAKGSYYNHILGMQSKIHLLSLFNEAFASQI